ncbi:MAG: TonB family protein [Gammaproteobacteria bacterium]|nr:TonB family protein [Gammaproteobacteria bacterium]
MASGSSIMLRRDLLEAHSARLLIACALSLAAHVLLIFNLPVELMPAVKSVPPHRTQISVEFRAPEAPAAAPATTLPQPIPKPSSPPAVAPEPAPEVIAQRPRTLQPIESLRTAWRSGESPDSAEHAPLRLTEQPSLSADARAYLASWQREVQRIGRLNFPTDDDGNRIRGSLRLLVGIDPDGSLAYVRVMESSRNASLDAAAERIVELAAPFAPVPQSLRSGDAPLEIERTWRIGASLVKL